MSELIDKLHKVAIKYPGAPALIPLRDLLEGDALLDFLRKQYPGTSCAGPFIQFIPSLRGERYPLDARLMPASFSSKYASDICGMQYEMAVQNLFLQLTDRRMILVHNFDRTAVRCRSIQKLMRNEFDLLVFDERIGVVIVEIKQRSFRHPVASKKFSVHKVIQRLS